MLVNSQYLGRTIDSEWLKSFHGDNPWANGGSEVLNVQNTKSKSPFFRCRTNWIPLLQMDQEEHIPLVHK